MRTGLIMGSKGFRIGLFLILAVTGGGSREADARSTLIARFTPRGIAGPGIEQSVRLDLHYFPGDGEAIVRTRLYCGKGEAELRAARSSLGEARVDSSGVEIDYGERPLGWEVDTLHIELLPLKKGRIRWRAEIHSSLDPGKVAHLASTELEVHPPLGLGLSVLPDRVFAGERIRLRVFACNQDTGRPVEDAVWEWPEGWKVEGEGQIRWEPPLRPGECDTLAWEVQVDPEEKRGEVSIGGRAGNADLAGSPFPDVALRVIPLPRARLSAAGGFLEAGRQGRVVYEWINDSGASLALEAVRVEIGEAFDQVEVEGEAAVVLESGEKNALLWENPGVLESGRSLRLAIRARPLRAGPFVWRSQVRPRGRDAFVPVEGETTVRVVRSLREKGTREERATCPTDLEMVGSALSEALRPRMEEMPLEPGAVVCIRPFERKGGKWIVEDALADLLMAGGDRVRIGAWKEGKGCDYLAYYRLVDARVVYFPAEKKWRVWRKKTRRREVWGDLFLRLETRDGRVVWTGRVRAYGSDQVPSDEIELLGGGEGISRTIVKSEDKLVERGLSASIVGGLFYIFFLL